MNFLATPEIYDDYPGELQLTNNEFPPYPTTCIGQLMGDINTEFTYTFSCMQLIP